MRNLVYGLQWVVFHSAEMGMLMQPTFFITGFASLIQILFGHRECLVEGPAAPGGRRISSSRASG
jgi:hypothetical protein